MTDAAETVAVRVWGASSLPTLVYLPGLHGDWTLIGGFRAALAGRVRFVEVTYPRTVAWSLAEYADGVESSLAAEGIHGGWLLGESFGSQVVWPLAERASFRTKGIILAGGFARHPMPWGAGLASWMTGVCPATVWKALVSAYARLARLRFRSEPGVRAGLDEFIARRTEEDRRAWVHRLHLVATNDPRAAARATQVPVHGLSGWLDPIVPWFLARPGLRRNCPALRDYQVLAADHNVLSTACAKAADQVLRWMGRIA